MSTYVIGDIHGCFESLQSLLSQIPLKNDDQLWCVGDLINRGPQSLQVLQWAKKNDSWVQVVLGNHELHFLACLFGATTASGDTLDELLNLPELERTHLSQWLRQQPILFESLIAGQHVAMVHAGLNSKWSWVETKRRAKTIELALQSDEGLLALAHAHPSRKRVKANISSGVNSDKQSKESSKALKAQWIQDLKWFTRVRTLDSEGRAVSWFKGNPKELPSHLSPWFEAYQSSWDSSYPNMLYYGHWAAFGLQKGASYYGLDSACIWGQHLSAVRIEDGALFQVSNQSSGLTPKHLRKSLKVLI